MSNDDSVSSAAHRDLIDQSMIQAAQARREFQKAAANNAISSRHHEALRDAVIDYHDALKRYQHKSAVSDTWEDYSLGDVEKLISETTTIERDNPRVHGSRTESVEVPLLRQVDAQRLLQYLDGFDEVATGLGFAAEVREQTPHEIGTKEDIRWLLNTREQSKAVAELDGPEQDAEEVANS